MMLKHPELRAGYWYSISSEKCLLPECLLVKDCWDEIALCKKQELESRIGDYQSKTGSGSMKSTGTNFHLLECTSFWVYSSGNQIQIRNNFIQPSCLPLAPSSGRTSKGASRQWRDAVAGSPLGITLQRLKRRQEIRVKSLVSLYGSIVGSVLILHAFNAGFIPSTSHGLPSSPGVIPEHLQVLPKQTKELNNHIR